MSPRTNYNRGNDSVLDFDNKTTISQNPRDDFLTKKADNVRTMEFEPPK